MPPMTISGFRGASSANAIFTQSTGVPLHDHISTPSRLERKRSRRGLVAEKAQEKPLQASSGAQTRMSPMSESISTSVLMPFA